MGLVDVRHGQGVFVRSAHEADAPAFARWNIEHGYSIGELLAFRLLVEPELAALAAEQADLPFIEELTAIMVSMQEAAARSDLPELTRLDTAFHDAITRRAGNRLYRDLLGQVGQLLIESRQISLGVPGRASQVVAVHYSIIEAIRTGNGDSAWAAMRGHLEKFAADMHIEPVGY